jgi:hypothetical protein
VKLKIPIEDFSQVYGNIFMTFKTNGQRPFGDEILFIVKGL